MNIDIEARIIAKFKVGDEVRIIKGDHANKTGMVAAVTGIPTKDDIMPLYHIRIDMIVVNLPESDVAPK
jgi:transcription antitermination factor NusG